MTMFSTSLMILQWIFMSSNEQKLITIFSEISNTTVVVNNQTVINDLALDSMDVLDVLMRIENELNVEIQIEQFSTCKDIASVNLIINNH